MYLIQLLLPASVMPGGAAASEPVTQTRRELTEAFGGLTAYLRTPALGIWTSPEGGRAQDDVVMVEVVAEQFDCGWWREYTRPPGAAVRAGRHPRARASGRPARP